MTDKTNTLNTLTNVVRTPGRLADANNGAQEPPRSIYRPDRPRT
jgi:hypothetical protein